MLNNGKQVIKKSILVNVKLTLLLQFFNFLVIGLL